ncbi:hypothetical protein LIA77_11522 [Sarocladium implicatum]|nr:hypothetical protein LIA77_11522 [Sarocladium implicatum]
MLVHWLRTATKIYQLSLARYACLTLKPSARSGTRSFSHFSFSTCLGINEDHMKKSLATTVRIQRSLVGAARARHGDQSPVAPDDHSKPSRPGPLSIDGGMRNTDRALRLLFFPH